MLMLAPLPTSPKQNREGSSASFPLHALGALLVRAVLAGRGLARERTKAERPGS
ncbi:Hypothetical protein A7982_05052 [Minicystis rosea]|nr:Hypothetical protein A7982_05052 [Minicystis rosea]